MIKPELFDKLEKILEVLQLKKVKFSILRSESLEPEFVNLISGIRESFDELHKKYNVKVYNLSSYPVSSGELSPELFIKFLKEYDEKFNLEYTMIDMGFLLINPSMF
ncbi:MAG: hypothetical protein QW507_00410 [Candidatus Nanoarchaeia archaeon]|nr:hypothetical protein [Candidatus Haiyanarchaeum thermophilum]MCW1302956.1 hypothetical protein [Candidatus Haiyanarchaeum thermophilum]MCW1303634.1 hypothetical protein [Candidatus Haiyanarchaeum thermophilum]MCW1306315.1 hypothetical protein [Candidatus Haiyanarchaeum thermophilum]MCW1307175.1 hypothetical protein [Candidatus Haiyanarchaeum thermophilum]